MSDNLPQNPDTYAELSNNPSAPLSQLDFSALGGLPYMTPLLVTGPKGSMVIYKRDVGAGGGPVPGGITRRIDLYMPVAQAIGINDLGSVTISIPTGSTSILGSGSSWSPFVSNFNSSLASTTSNGIPQ